MAVFGHEGFGAMLNGMGLGILAVDRPPTWQMRSYISWTLAVEMLPRHTMNTTSGARESFFDDR